MSQKDDGADIAALHSSGAGNRGVMRIASPGHAAFAATMIALGVLGLVNPAYAAVWSPVSIALPGHRMLGDLCAVLSLAFGIGLLWRRAAAIAAHVLLVYLLIWALLVSLPGIFSARGGFGSWYSLAEAAVMVAAAWVLYARFTPDSARQRLRLPAGSKGVRIARVLFGLSLIYFGMGHIFFLKQTASAVPSWLPWHVGWAYLTGFSFIAAGLAILVGLYARLAATLSAFQIGLFVLLVWVPIVAAAGPVSAFQWSETIISAALTAGSWVVADSYRGVPWLAVNKH